MTTKDDLCRHFVAILSPLWRLDIEGCKRIKPHRITQMVWRKVGVNHRVIDLLMTEDFLQYKNVAAVRHEVTRERMT